MKKKIVLAAVLTVACIFFTIDIRAQSQQPEYITNQPAPAFELKDMDGKTVSLTDYKGKVVVLDFWATWCGPCKMSFPGMQIALNKYKDDKDVQFLFIDTRERADNYKDLVKNFLADNHYSFKVIFDEKGEGGVQNKFFKTYKLMGIPTKFIIDRDGIVRFENIGYMPGMSDQELANEVSGMIEKAKKATDNKVPAKTR
ncbi:TlpA family protein disulfide reductase [Mucilaginibacter ximonensis]|uniref:TlpA family protein disulfide reductase n=1 Tax=Mucilaginibacter ximonensis TaxID=538021 RepID=A0ABW5YA60_9SPHI